MAGWVMERYSVAGSYMLGSKRRRYAVFDMLQNSFSLFLSEESALLDDKPPELRVKVKFAVRRPQKDPDTYDFAFSAADMETEAGGFSNRFHEFTVEKEAQQLGWLEALPPPREYTVQGYLHKKRFGAMKLTDSFDLRFAVYDVITGYFSYYEKEDEALMNLQPKGHVRIVSAVMRPTHERPFMFSFFTEDGKDYQLYVDNEEKMHMWMNSLPIYSGQYGANADKIMTTLREEVESLKRQMKAEGADGMGGLSAGQAMDVGGPQLARGQRLGN
eukprot:2076058-Prymnesium_polylepis.1